MTRLTKYTIQLISGLLLALLTAGCVADRNVSDCITEGEEVELEFAVQVPALETSLRGLSAEQEKAVKDIQLFVFNTQDDSGQDLDEPNETFAYEAEVKSKTQEGNTIRIRCALKASSKPMRVVCIANAPTKIGIQDFTNKTKQTILEDVQMNKNFTAAWATDGSQFIPMWGESDKQPVTRNTKFNSCDVTGLGGTGVNPQNEGTIHLVRALARIDVGCSFDESKPADETAKGSDKFKIKSVRVYRYATSMYMTGTQSTTFNFNGTTREAKPHTPAGVGTAADANPLEFEAAKGGVDGYVRNIYIPEISNQGDKDHRTCLVIGGYYNGSDKETYYRVDFMRTENGTPKYLDVLRNHRYRFNITDIKGPGTSDPGDALITEPVNITCDVVVWNEAKIDQIVYDGQYYLAVSKDKFHFGKNKANDSYTIRTNWPKGYKIVDKDGNDWPKTEQAAKDSGKWFYFTEPASQTFKEGKDMSSTINVLENTTSGGRTINRGYLFVQAGRIKWPLVVSQSNKVELEVKIYLNETGDWRTDCAKEPINAHTCIPGKKYKFWVKYTEGATLARIPVDRDEQFEWEKISDEKSLGIASYSAIVQETSVPLDEFWLSEITKFRVVKDEATAITDFTLNYMKWDAIPYKTQRFTHNMLKEDVVYVLSDFRQRFYIRANAPYKVTVEHIEIEPLDGNPTKDQVVKEWHEKAKIDEKIQPAFLTGERLDFNTYDHIGNKDQIDLGDNKIIAASVKLRISPKEATEGQPGYFAPREFTVYFVSAIMQPEANSYVVEEGQMPILIPCSQINRAADWWNENVKEMENTMKARLTTSSLEQKFDKDQYAKYIAANGGVKLPYLLESDKPGTEDKPTAGGANWVASCVWSTIEPSGSDHGFKTIKGIQLKIGGKNFIYVQPKAGLEGCAVISVVKNYKSANQRILWNWMIWVIRKKSNGGQGYPWDDNDNKTKGAPYMNRNLGAYKMAADPTKGVFYNKFEKDMCGLYYKHGTPVPHHVYDQDGTSHCTKVWYNSTLVPEGKQTNMSNKHYCKTAQWTDLCSMQDIINKPAQSLFKAAESEYILEFGTTEWGGSLMKKIWQGGDGVTILNNEANFERYRYKTEKTPFDPSPYGWKVPAAGKESMDLGNSNNLFWACTAIIPRGDINNRTEFKATGSGTGVNLHVATRFSNSDRNVLNFTDNGNGSWSHIIAGGNIRLDASTQLQIRCIENEAEDDYRDYTAAGVMQNARSAMRAARSYHRR
ncbi:hypothetical protein [Porphyromonas uenonis]